MYGLDNFIIGKTKERRGEGRVGKKSNICLTNIERRGEERGELASIERRIVERSRSSREEKREERRRVVEVVGLKPNKSATAYQKTAALVSLLAQNR
jgi:hypothetical protein